jgi:hypothetical protein
MRLRAITVRYHSLRAWFRRMADFGLWMSPQNPHKSASAAGGPHKNSTYKTALPGTAANMALLALECLYAGRTG